MTNSDILFTHWPIDTHMDHQAAAMLTYRAWLARQPDSGPRNLCVRSDGCAVSADICCNVASYGGRRIRARLQPVPQFARESWRA